MKTLIKAVVCLLVASPLFAQSQVPYLQTNAPAASTVFNGSLYLFHVKSGQPNGYLFYQTSNGTSWSTPSPVPQSQLYLLASSSQPRATVFNGRLYVFYTASDSQIHYWSMDSAGNWNSTAGTIPGASSGHTPGVSAFNGRLYAAWRATGTNTSLFYASMDTGGTWTGTARLSTGESSRGPALASFVAVDGYEYLYGVWKNKACLNCVETMWYARIAPFSGWSPGAQVESGDYPMTARDQALTATDSGLALVYTGGYSAGLYYKNLTSSQLWQDEVLADASAPQSGTSASFFNGHLHTFHLANGFIYEEIVY